MHIWVTRRDDDDFLTKKPTDEIQEKLINIFFTRFNTTAAG